MDLSNIVVANLKEAHTLERVLAEINKQLPNCISVSDIDSWDALEANRSYLEAVIRATSKNNEQLFLSKEAEYIFYLTELGEDEKMTKLGVTKIHYKSREKARDLKNRISQCIHPDSAHYKRATEAQASLNEWFEGVKLHAKR
ncbi:MAG: hypothetical protein HAW67_01525 [Endozoicomonadaceae bacterium]|nr:hypothetical protein [Endozoicomonadaceae bacterium]